MRTVPGGISPPGIHAFNMIVTGGLSMRDFMIKIKQLSRSTLNSSIFVSMDDYNIAVNVTVEGNLDYLQNYCAKVDVSGNLKKIPVAEGKYPLHCFYLLHQINTLAKNSGNNDVEELINTEYESLMSALKDDEIPYEHYPDDAILNEVSLIRSTPTVDSPHGLSPNELAIRFNRALNVPLTSRASDTSTIASYYSSVSRQCSVSALPGVQPVGLHNVL